MLNKKENLIEIICGPMFSGKTEKLIEIIQKFQKDKVKMLIFKSHLDIRFSSEAALISHKNKKAPAYLIKKSQEILNFIENDTEAIIIDETQFFDKNIINVIETLVDKNIKVILAGLDLDFRGKPFGPMPELLALADNVIKTKSVCAISGKLANRTQRLVNNKPAKIGDDIIVLEHSNLNITYEPRAKKYHNLIKK